MRRASPYTDPSSPQQGHRPLSQEYTSRDTVGSSDSSHMRKSSLSQSQPETAYPSKSLPALFCRHPFKKLLSTLLGPK